MARPINSFQKFRDADGNAVSAGTLTFYENKTTTKISIFSDVELTIPQNNPYTLDGAGRIIGDVFFTGTVSIQVSDVNGAQIRTLDDITGTGVVTDDDLTFQQEVFTASQLTTSLAGIANARITLTTFTYQVDVDNIFVFVNGGYQDDIITISDTIIDLTFSTDTKGEDNIVVWRFASVTAGTLNAGTISYLYPGTGAVTSNLQAVNDNRDIDVKSMFGALGDGATDDRTAIDTANTAAGVGGTLHFPRGTYLIASNLTLSSATTFDEGAKLKPNTGVVVTMTGPIEAGNYEIFDNTSVGTFDLSDVENTGIPIAWFGIEGDGSDEGAAMNTAFTAIGIEQTVLFLGKTYGTSIDLLPEQAQLLLGPGSGLDVVGAEGANILATANSFTSAMIVIDPSGGTIRGLHLRGADLAPAAIALSVSRAVVEFCSFGEFTGDFIINSAENTNSPIIRNNRFSQPPSVGGFINLIDCEIFAIEQNAFVLASGNAFVTDYLVKVSSVTSTEFSPGTVTGNNFSGNATGITNSYTSGIIVDQRGVYVAHNQFAINAAATHASQHMEFTTRADKCFSVNNFFISDGTVTEKIVIDSGAAGVTIEGGNLSWDSSTGVDITDNGTNTLISFGTGSTNQRLWITDDISIVSPDGGQAFRIDTSANRIFWAHDVNSLNNIELASGAMIVNSALDLSLNTVSGNSINSTVDDVVETSVDANRTANETNMSVKVDVAGTLVRMVTGAADSGGSGFRLLRVPN